MDNKLQIRTSKLFHENILLFQESSQLYKSFLDNHYAERFCTGEHCKTIYMVEIKFTGDKWGATPKKFYTEEDAGKEAKSLKMKYPFIRECRIVTRKKKEEYD